MALSAAGPELCRSCGTQAHIRNRVRLSDYAYSAPRAPVARTAGLDPVAASGPCPTHLEGVVDGRGFCGSLVEVTAQVGVPGPEHQSHLRLKCV